MSSGRLFQATGPATQMPGCRVVASFWVPPNHHEQWNGEQKGWEQWKLERTSRSHNMVPGRGLPCTPVGRVWTRCVPLQAASADDREVADIYGWRIWTLLGVFVVIPSIPRTIIIVLARVHFWSSEWKSISTIWPPTHRPGCKLDLWVCI